VEVPRKSMHTCTFQQRLRTRKPIIRLHFERLTKLVNRLAAAEPGQWRAVLESSDDTSLGQYGRDSNWMLLRSALRQMAETLPNPVFVIVSGDFLAHSFRRTFDAAASDHSDAAYRVFVRKTMQFLAQQLRQSFPAAPILPALGNNDDVCGDYQLQPGGPFLADTLPILHTLLGGDATGIDQNWTSYGNYRIAVGGVRVLSANTNFFSIHYRNACGSPSDAISIAFAIRLGTMSFGSGMFATWKSPALRP